MFESIQGQSGQVVIASNGAVPGIMNHWQVTRSGVREDGTPVLRLRASFSYVNKVLIDLPAAKQVILHVRSVNGPEKVAVKEWRSWSFNGTDLVLEDVKFND